MRRLDRASPYALVLVGIWTASSSALAGAAWLRPVQLIAGIVLVSAGSYLLGLRRASGQVLETLTGILGSLPGALTFHEDDDGHHHALVTTFGGDVRAIPIPDDVEGPQEAVFYVMRVLTDEGET